MASAWGIAWGTTWGNAWGLITEEETPKRTGSVIWLDSIARPLPDDDDDEAVAIALLLGMD